MSHELKVDEKHLKNLIENAESLIEAIESDLEVLKDKKEDNFVRYMAYMRTFMFVRHLPDFIQVVKFAMSSGHALNHEVFQTEKGKESEWDTLKPHLHPFFV